MLVGPTHQPSLQPELELVIGTTDTLALIFTASDLAKARARAKSEACPLTRCLRMNPPIAGAARDVTIAKSKMVTISSIRVNPLLFCITGL